ncbi:MAG: 3-deoxy-7-phosphoheptulonate synthase class II, partial [Bdellovibrionales bacterium]|nr:3-deoxy-7-phosphoheptulonate synthase class II [Bdellovibrionales bacterium]
GSWRKKEISQTPTYPNPDEVMDVEDRLRSLPPLVFEGEIERLSSRLASVQRGEAFLLQGGDCAESFSDLTTGIILNNFRILLQMALVLTFGGKRPVVKVGRVAGQYAKPRSQDLETRDGVTLPTYRGDMINGFDFNKESRVPDPQRLERAYYQSAATLNTLRSMAQGGFADLHQVNAWNLDFLQRGPKNARYEDIVRRLNDTLGFMKAVGVANGVGQAVETIELYTSHEGLMLNYEEALTRLRKNHDGWFAGSAHMLWLGDRTRNLEGAHVEFLRGISNPVGIKCGPTMKEEDLLRLIDRINPSNTAGRVTLITRLGSERAGQLLPKLIRRVQSEGKLVVWACDPMHGNTYSTNQGIKTRSFQKILSEVRTFFECHRGEGTHPGGVHLELTGRDVVECVGGIESIREDQLAAGGYETFCDPRLNASQALELAFQLVE